MEKSGSDLLASVAVIYEVIYLVRGQKVMFDADLAKLYGVETRRLNEAVKRNIGRFLSDFMFQLNQSEFENWKSHIAISNPSVKMGLRKKPFVFTENGVAMLSSVLNSERAINVNISIMRTFTKIRQFVVSNDRIAEKMKDLEKRLDEKDTEIQVIFKTIQRMMVGEDKPKKPIGFIQ